MFPLKFIEKIHNYKITLNEAIEELAELKELINKLNDYGPRISKKAKEKNSVLESARKLFDARDEIIDLFEKGIFPYKDNAFKTKEKETEERSEESTFCKRIENESQSINYNLFKEYFNFESPIILTKKLFETKDKKKNNDLIESIKARWSNLKDETEKMSEDKKKI